jgi:hypothetical protein
LNRPLLLPGTPPKPRARARDARSRLERLQRRLLRRIQGEILDLAGPPPAAVRRYEAEYGRHVRAFRAESTKAALVERVAKSDVVFCGDFHTLALSQKVAIRILREVVRERPDVVLALEMVRSDHQAEVDRFLGDGCPEEDFLRAIDYYRTWDFDWPNYAPLFAFAREERVPILALNSDGARAGSLRSRDRRAARVLAASHAARPDALHFVLYGDFHVSPEHLPLEFARALPRGFPVPRSLRIYQNSEEIHFTLAAGGRETAVDVVEIDDESFCVQSATPLVKWSSYLHWEERHGSAHLADHPDWDDAEMDGQNLAERFEGYVTAIAEYLGLSRPRLPLTIWTPYDAGLGKALGAEGPAGRRLARLLGRGILAREACFLRKERLLYLPESSLNHMAADAALFLLDQRARGRGPRSPRERFYRETLRAALAYAGSKIVNPKRKCTLPLDYERLIAERGAPGRTGRAQARTLRRARRLVRYFAAEERAASRGRLPDARWAIFRLPAKERLEVARRVGSVLGHRLVAAMWDGRFAREEMRALFLLRLAAPDAATRSHFRLLARLGPLRGIAEAKHDFL